MFSAEGFMQADRWVGQTFFNVRARTSGAEIGYRLRDEREAVDGSVRLRPEAVEGAVDHLGSFRPLAGGPALADRWVSDFFDLRRRPDLRLRLVRAAGFVDRGGTFRERPDGAMTYERWISEPVHNVRDGAGAGDAEGTPVAAGRPEPGTLMLGTETLTGVRTGPDHHFEPSAGGDVLADRYASRFTPAAAAVAEPVAEGAA
jgi:hypothetical protein